MHQTALKRRELLLVRRHHHQFWTPNCDNKKSVRLFLCICKEIGLKWHRPHDQTFISKALRNKLRKVIQKYQQIHRIFLKLFNRYWQFMFTRIIKFCKTKFEAPYLLCKQGWSGVNTGCVENQSQPSLLSTLLCFWSHSIWKFLWSKLTQLRDLH